MLKGQQDTYRRLCGKSYNREYLGYLCVDEIGNIIRPNYVSEQFPKLLEKNGLRPIRFHDLRHSCVSMMPYAPKTGWTGDAPAKKEWTDE